MKKTTYFGLGFVGCSVLALILQTVAVPVSFEVGTNYFENGAILPILASVFAIFGAILGTVAAFTADPATFQKSPLSKKPSFTPLTLGFVVTAVILLLQNADNATAKNADQFLFRGTDTFTAVTAGLLILAALYSVLVEIPKLRETSLPALLGLFAIVSFVAINAYYYFDMTVEMNAPVKVTTQIGLLCAMLALTGELRYLLGKPMPRLFLALSAWVVSIGALSALSVPLSYLLGKIDRIDYAAGGVLVLCAVLTSLLRIRSLLRTSTEQEDAPISAATDKTDESL